MACGPKCPCPCVRTKKRRSHKVLAPRHNPVYDLLAFLVGEKYKEPVNKPKIANPSFSVGTSTEPTATREVGVGEPIATREVGVGEPTATREVGVGEPTATREVGVGKPIATRSTETQVEQVLEKVEPIAVYEGVQKKKQPYEPYIQEKERQKYNEMIDKILVSRGKLPSREQRRFLRGTGLTPFIPEDNVSEEETAAAIPASEVEAPASEVEAPVQSGIPAFFGGAQQSRVRLVRPKKDTPLGNIVASLQAIPEQEAGSESNVDFQ